MAGLTQQRCSIIAAKLNTRPRKRLAYKTPEECFYEQLLLSHVKLDTKLPISPNLTKKNLTHF
ncbi:MAG: hypothetical protein QS721_04900 [Candidatus Endonucleobacter sp. (ex Gigantidas childressi)]|nr:hypothetical protein [Candidatus Endonucleobacter sp. (ex Gigantidas childressi)]